MTLQEALQHASKCKTEGTLSTSGRALCLLLDHIEELKLDVSELHMQIAALGDSQK
jgi:hypothetical protein